MKPELPSDLAELKQVVRRGVSQVGERLSKIAAKAQAVSPLIRQVHGAIGTVDAELCWVHEVASGETYELQLDAPGFASLRTTEKRLHLTGLKPNTIYKGHLRSLSQKNVGFHVGFATRALGPCGYVAPLSAAPGEEVDIFVSTDQPRIDVAVRKLVNTDVLLGRWELEGKYQYAPYNASSEGCRWQRSVTLRVPDDAESAVYLVYLEDGSRQFVAPLIVRPKSPPKVAVVCSTDTWNAYNQWGGQSFYENPIGGPEPAWVTQNRPNPYANPWGPGTHHLLEGETPVHQWLARNGIEFGVYTDDDMAAGRLLGAETVFLVTHNEYWCADKLAALDALQAAGANIITLSGNTLWRRTIRDTSRQAILRYGVYVDEEVCPRLGTIYTAVGRDTQAPYEVVMPDHWLFEGLDVKRGTRFGQDPAVQLAASGVETDKRTAYTPADAEVIARGLNPDAGGAEWVVFRHRAGGLVVNAGSITMSLHASDPVVSGMLHNLSRKLGFPLRKSASTT